MIAFRPLACLVVLVLIPTQLAAQEVNFSGRWALVSASKALPDVPAALLVHQTVVQTTVRGEPMTPLLKDITVAREFKSGSRSETYQIGVVGGSVPGVPAGRSPGAAQPHHYAVKWEGQTLVIENGERREVWSLDPQGRLNVAITTRNSGNNSKTMMLVYRRQ